MSLFMWIAFFLNKRDIDTFYKYAMAHSETTVQILTLLLASYMIMEIKMFKVVVGYMNLVKCLAQFLTYVQCPIEAGFIIIIIIIINVYVYRLIVVDF